jgi:hypothetical protein
MLRYCTSAATYYNTQFDFPVELAGDAGFEAESRVGIGHSRCQLDERHGVRGRLRLQKTSRFGIVIDVIHADAEDTAAVIG